MKKILVSTKKINKKNRITKNKKTIERIKNELKLFTNIKSVRYNKNPTNIDNYNLEYNTFLYCIKSERLNNLTNKTNNIEDVVFFTDKPKNINPSKFKVSVINNESYTSKYINNILKIYNDIYYDNVTFGDITKQNRKQKYVFLRHTISFFLWKKGITYKIIGKILKRNHATIIHSVRTAQNVKEIKQIIENIETEFKKQEDNEI